MAGIPLREAQRSRLLAQILQTPTATQQTFNSPLGTGYALLGEALKSMGAMKGFEQLDDKEKQRQHALSVALSRMGEGDLKGAMEPLSQWNPEAAASLQIQQATAKPEEKTTWRPMTKEEKAAYNIPADMPAQINSLGQVSGIGSGGTNIDINNNMPPENIPLDKKNTTDATGNLLKAQGQLDSLRGIRAKYQPQFLTYGGKLKGAKASTWEKLGGELSDEDRQFLNDYTEFSSTGMSLLNATINMLSGAATSVQEAERIRSEIPDPKNDSPTEFIAKFNAKMEQLARVQARNYYAIKNGLSMNEWPSIDNINGVIESRGKELEREYKASGVPADQVDDAVLAQLRREFGIQ